MNQPIIKSGKFHAGCDLQCGENVVIDVAEEVIVGDRCVIPDNAYFCGRRVEIGDDFYGYSWEWKRLDIGRGRHYDEYAVLKIGNRCTVHENKIDLARAVTIGDDVGLSPEVAIYTHGYWQSVLEGYPTRYSNVSIGNNTIVGFRSVLLAGADIGPNSVIGAQSVVCGKLDGGVIYGGSPAKFIKRRDFSNRDEQSGILNNLLNEYIDTLRYRNLGDHKIITDFPFVKFRGIRINVNLMSWAGEEDEYTDDLRDFLFRHGIRIYTKRLFRRLGK